MKVIQTWDDGIVSDIQLIEILKRYQARASFCLTPGLYQESRSFGWTYQGREVWRLGTRELADVYDGFEICSHSMTHPRLTDLSEDRLHWELQTSKTMLEQIFQKPISGFCYPFNACNDFVKDAVSKAGYRWARGNQNRDNVYPPENPFEFHPSCRYLDCDFWNKFDRQRETNGVFFFWGHSYELVTEAMWQDFESTIKAISLVPGVEWAFISDLFPEASQHPGAFFHS